MHTTNSGYNENSVIFSASAMYRHRPHLQVQKRCGTPHTTTNLLIL